MTPYRAGPPSDRTELPAFVTLDPARLDAPARGRLEACLDRALAGRLAASRELSRAAAIVIGLAALALGIYAVHGGLGLVIGDHAAAGGASLVYGSIAGCMALAVAALRTRSPPRVGRVLVREGLLDLGRSGVRFAPADRIATVELEGRSRCVVTLEGGGKLVVEDAAGVAEDVLARGEEIRRARAAGDRRELARLELFSREALAGARRPSSWRPAPAGVALAAGLAVGLVAHSWVLPWLSFARSRAGDGPLVWHLGAVARSYPLPWVEARAEREVHAARARARAALLPRLTPAGRAAFTELLDWLSEHDQVLIGVRMVGPPAPIHAGVVAWRIADALGPIARETIRVAPESLRRGRAAAFVLSPGPGLIVIASLEIPDRPPIALGKPIGVHEGEDADQAVTAGLLAILFRDGTGR